MVRRGAAIALLVGALGLAGVGAHAPTAAAVPPAHHGAGASHGRPAKDRAAAPVVVAAALSPVAVEPHGESAKASVALGENAHGLKRGRIVAPPVVAPPVPALPAVATTVLPAAVPAPTPVETSLTTVAAAPPRRITVTSAPRTTLPGRSAAVSQPAPAPLGVPGVLAPLAPLAALPRLLPHLRGPVVAPSARPPLLAAAAALAALLVSGVLGRLDRRLQRAPVGADDDTIDVS